MNSEQLRGHFDRHAVEFDALYDPWRQTPFGRWLNRHFRSDIVGRYLAALEHVRASGAASVLDVGCGPGHYLSALAALGIPRLVGIDVSEKMISLARNRPDISRSSTVELIHDDFMNWQSDSTFDIVLALGFFDYVRDPVPVLKKMRGHAAHSVFASFPSRHWLRTPFRWTRRRIQGTKVYFYSSVGIGRLATEAGFSKVDICPLPRAGMNLLATFSCR